MTIKHEIWKDINGFEGYYQISNLGRIKSLPRIMSNGHTNYLSKEKILKPIAVGDYLGVQLISNKSKRKFYIHRLVANAFIDNPMNKKVVNHLDGDKFNNIVLNLEWCTHRENNIHALNIGLSNVMGEKNPMCKYSDEVVKEVRKLYKTGKYKQSELAEVFGISRMQVNRIVRNLLRKDVI
jgi:hypothetical protein